MSDAYQQLMERVRDLGRMGSIEQLLDWDQEVNMPPKGVTARAEQIALLAGMAHEWLVSDRTRSLLESASAGKDDYVAQTNLRETRRHFERAVRVPTELVKKIAHASSLSKEAWANARKRKEFHLFAPHLNTMVELKKQLAEHIGYKTEPYDALMDEFEPGATSKEIEALFSLLQGMTVTLLGRLQGARSKPDRSILQRDYSEENQKKLSRRMAEALGFDFSAGRDDVSVHPFCCTVGGSGDVRITTRYERNFLPAALFGTMHEAGHGLYEQGLSAEHRYTPMGSAVSLGIHESQSRLWENMVGRSRPFWECYYAELTALFPESLNDVSLDSFCGAINTVAPSFIRVEADELTYNLHIILRFEIERALFNGSLTVNDVPAVWNEKFNKLLGVTPPDDAQGCLQDIHWSMGAFGYFATYALGNLYAAQFFQQARSDIESLDEHIRAGDHSPLLKWLRQNIHQHGQRYRASELVEVVTGKPLSIEPFTRYTTDKFSSVYGV